MRAIPDAFRARLGRTATTLARGWRVTRGDGAVLGFTDHDEPLAFAGTRFEAASGMAAGEAERSLGLSTGTQEVEGALSSASLDEGDIEAGLYDGAKVECFVVDWAAPEHFLLVDVATIGEIRRREGAFTAELRGPEAALERPRGRLYRRRCDAVLGDARCRADLSAGRRTREGEVAGEEGAVVSARGLGAFAFSDFAGGLLVLTSGAAAGVAREVVSVSAGLEAGEVRIALVEPLPRRPAPSDGLRLTAGCDKSFATCRTRFGNQLNFRGFPHLPGVDAAMGVAKSDALHDGGAVVP